MKINVHGGHNKRVPGIISYLDEVAEDRKLKNEVISLLKSEGHTVYDSTDDNGRLQNLNLRSIVKKCNSHDVDLNVAIHLNGFKKTKKDGKTKGTEVLICSSKSKAKDEATRICNNLVKLGFTNRGIKVRSDLYVLRHTNDPALLIEVCFADDEDDVLLYKKLGIEKIAKAIVEGILNKKLPVNKEVSSKSNVKVSKSFKVKTKTSLAVRAGAGLKYRKVKTAKPSIYTIKEVKYNGKTPWGRLSSGSGWISLASKYSSRV